MYIKCLGDKRNIPSTYYSFDSEDCLHTDLFVCLLMVFRRQLDEWINGKMDKWERLGGVGVYVESLNVV